MNALSAGGKVLDRNLEKPHVRTKKIFEIREFEHLQQGTRVQFDQLQGPEE
jgi:hypothetical protein